MHGFTEARKATLSNGRHQLAPILEVTIRRRLAHARAARDFPKRKSLRAIATQYLDACLDERGLQVTVVVCAGRRPLPGGLTFH
jgi:hypothetical protein